MGREVPAHSRRRVGVVHSSRAEEREQRRGAGEAGEADQQNVSGMATTTDVETGSSFSFPFWHGASHIFELLAPHAASCGGKVCVLVFYYAR